MDLTKEWLLHARIMLNTTVNIASMVVRRNDIYLLYYYVVLLLMDGECANVPS